MSVVVWGYKIFRLWLFWLTCIDTKYHCYSDDECGFDDSDSEDIYSHTEENSNDEIINRCIFGQRHLIGARLSSTTTLLESGEPEELNTLNDTSNSDSKNDNVPKQPKIQTYPTILKLISGTLVGGANYNEIHLDPDDEDAFNSCSTNDIDTRNKAKNTKNVPTLPEIARKVAKLQKIQLDKNNTSPTKLLPLHFFWA